MNFEIGKKYVTRGGRTVKCDEFDEGDAVFPWHFDDRRWRGHNGKYRETRDEVWEENDLDIVAAVEEQSVPWVGFEVGKKHVTRGGKTVECIKFDVVDPVFMYKFDDGLWRDREGKYKETRNDVWKESKYDIVSAVDEPHAVEPSVSWVGFEIGDEYTTRGGKTVTCIDYDEDDDELPWSFSDGRWRSDKGRYSYGDEDWKENEHDIVLTAEKPPIPAAEQGIALPGLPEGYLALRVDTPRRGEAYLMPEGDVRVAPHNISLSFLIVKKVTPPEPVCVWPKGVFKDGWLAEDENKEVYWFSVEPKPGQGYWRPDMGLYQNTNCIAGEIKFRSDLDWKERIVKVGPGVEND